MFGRALLEKAGDYLGGPKRRMAARLIARARELRGAGHFREAAILYEEALHHRPGRAAVHLQCGHMFKEAGALDRAETHYLAARLGRPDDPDLALQIGHFYKLAGRPADAEAEYRRALALAPGTADAARELAHLHDSGWRGRPAARRTAEPVDATPAEAERIARLAPSLAPRPDDAIAPAPEERIAVRRLGRYEIGYWGNRRTLRGIEAIHGFCVSATPIVELRIVFHALVIHREPLAPGHALPDRPAAEPARKYVFNAWLDFAQFGVGLHTLELRFLDAAGGSRSFHDQVVVAAALPEADFPASDALVAATDDDPRPIEAQIRSRPSMVRPARRTLFPGGVGAILVQRTDQLGDLIASIPAVRRLRELAPGARLVALLTAANAELAHTLDLFDEIIVVDFPDDAVERRRLMPLDAQETLRRRLAAYAFDIAIDLAQSDVSRDLLRLSGARFTFGVGSADRPWLTGEYVLNTHDRWNGLDIVPHSAKVLGMVESLGAMLKDSAPVVPRPDLSRDRLRRHGIAADDRFVLLHAGARVAFSRWPHFAELAALLLDRTDLRVVLMAEDPRLGAALPAELLGSARFVLIDRRLPFDDFDALVTFSTVLVGNDSGPKHLAALRGTNVVTLFTARINWAEWGQENVGTINQPARAVRRLCDLPRRRGVRQGIRLHRRHRARRSPRCGPGVCLSAPDGRPHEGRQPARPAPARAAPAGRADRAPADDARRCRARRRPPPCRGDPLRGGAPPPPRSCRHPHPGRPHVQEAGELARAEPHYLAAQAIAPGDAELALQLGHFCKVAGRLDEAATWYARAGELRPGWAAAADELAQLAGADLRREPDGDTDIVGELLPGSAAPASSADAIQVAPLGRLERTAWGTLPTLRGVVALRGFSRSAERLATFEIRCGDRTIHEARAPENAGKFVFNVWHDFSGWPEGLCLIEFRCTGTAGTVRVRRERVAVASPLDEASYPDSDGLVALAPGDRRSPEAQIDARPSMIRPARRTLMRQSPRTVLVQRVDQLGDLIVSVPAIRRLRVLLDGARLIGLLSPANAELAAALGLFDEIVVVDFPEEPATGRRVMARAAQRDLRRRLAAYRFDLAIDLSENGAARALLLLSGAPLTYAFGSRALPWLSAGVAGFTRDPIDGHEMVPPSARMVGMVEWLGAVLRSHATVAPRGAAPDRLACYGIAPVERYALLHGGARLAFSRWPHLAALAALILERTDIGVVLMADDRSDPSGLPPALEASPRFRRIDGQLPFDDFDALLASAAVMVGNDSGPKHLAALRGVPVVSLHMARTNWNEWGQEHDGLIVSRKVPCAGCAIHAHGDECGKDFACLVGIAPEEVFRAVAGLL